MLDVDEVEDVVLDDVVLDDVELEDDHHCAPQTDTVMPVINRLAMTATMNPEVNFPFMKCLPLSCMFLNLSRGAHAEYPGSVCFRKLV